MYSAAAATVCSPITMDFASASSSMMSGSPRPFVLIRRERYRSAWEGSSTHVLSLALRSKAVFGLEVLNESRMADTSSASKLHCWPNPREHGRKQGRTSMRPPLAAARTVIARQIQEHASTMPCNSASDASFQVPLCNRQASISLASVSANDPEYLSMASCQQPGSQPNAIRHLFAEVGAERCSVVQTPPGGSPAGTPGAV